jgi:hypothetical protein
MYHNVINWPSSNKFGMYHNVINWLYSIKLEAARVQSNSGGNICHKRIAFNQTRYVPYVKLALFSQALDVPYIVTLRNPSPCPCTNNTKMAVRRIFVGARGESLKRRTALEICDAVRFWVIFFNLFYLFILQFYGVNIKCKPNRVHIHQP